jgi:hypothetical protein
MSNPISDEIHKSVIRERHRNHLLLGPELDHLLRQRKRLQWRHLTPDRRHRPYRLPQNRIGSEMGFAILTGL